MINTFGFELEFASNLDMHNVLNTVRKFGFELEYDGSANWNMRKNCKAYGYEIQSPMFSKFETIRESFQNTLDYIRTIGIIGPCCGFHIHFSGQEIDRDALVNYLNQRMKIWNPRKEYTGGYKQNPYSKYQTVREIEDDDCHYEARCFNSTMNFRAVLNYFRILKSGLENQGVSTTL
jgi:hypothetical protein